MYRIQVRETGVGFEAFNTYKEAIDRLATYEKEDKADGLYEENFYEIVEE